MTTQAIAKPAAALDAMKLHEWVALIGLGLIWGSSFFWIKIAIAEIGPFLLVAMRLGFGILGLIGVVAIQRPALPMDGRTWGMLILLGFINTALPFTLISWGEIHIDSAVAAILNSTAPLFTLLIAHLLLHDERIVWNRLLGLVVGFAGIVILVARDLTGASGGPMTVWGQAAVLAASISYAFAAVFARRNLKAVAPIVQAFVAVAAADSMLWLAAFTLESPIALPVLPITWIALAWLGLLGSCAAYLLYYYLIQNIGATRAATVTYFFPVIGAALGVVFLRETLDLPLVAAVAIVIGGLWLANSKRKPAGSAATEADTNK